jgi:hypothetical protein
MRDFLYRLSRKPVKKYGKQCEIRLRPEIIVTHWADFHETHAFSTTFRKELLYRML